MALDDYQEDAFAYLNELLRSYGLDSLTDFAREQIIEGVSPTVFRQLLWERPEFKQRFKVIFDRRAKGLSPMTPQEVIEYETRAREMFRAAGLPPNFYDSPDDFHKFMAGDVSLSEVNDRIKLAQTSAFSTDPVARAEFSRLYGATAGDLTAYFLDPQKALPVLQNRMMGAQVGGASIRSGFGLLTAAEAQELVSQGVETEEAEKGFGMLATSQELMSNLAGVTGGDGQITREEQLSATFGANALTAERIRKRARERQAAFASGGEFFSSKSGFAGLGSA